MTWCMRCRCYCNSLVNVLVRDPHLSQYLVDSVNTGRVPTIAPVNSDNWLTELLRLCSDVLQGVGPCDVEALLDKVRDVHPELVEQDIIGVKKAEQLQQDWALPLQYLLDELRGHNAVAGLQPTPQADSVSHCWFSQHYQPWELLNSILLSIQHV